jgi:hypothetical protein
MASAFLAALEQDTFRGADMRPESIYTAGAIHADDTNWDYHPLQNAVMANAGTDPEQNEAAIARSEKQCASGTYFKGLSVEELVLQKGTIVAAGALQRCARGRGFTHAPQHHPGTAGACP